MRIWPVTWARSERDPVRARGRALPAVDTFLQLGDPRIRSLLHRLDDRANLVDLFREAGLGFRGGGGVGVVLLGDEFLLGAQRRAEGLRGALGCLLRADVPLGELECDRPAHPVEPRLQQLAELFDLGRRFLA